jgi:hypothetical protein
LKVAPQKYASTVKYPDTPIAHKLRGIAQVHFADLGSRIFYCDHGSFDLWKDVSEGLEAFTADLREHDHADNVIILLFSEFGRRVHDNGSGTDHGAAGPAFILGHRFQLSPDDVSREGRRRLRRQSRQRKQLRDGCQRGEDRWSR